MKLLISDGLVLGDVGLVRTDVLIEDGEIIRMEPDLDTAVDERIRARGCLVGPGFVDLHTHFRDPGHTWKEDLESGSAAAAAGGFTAAVAMPNTKPCLDHPGLVTDVMRRARRIGVIDVTVAAALTRGRGGREPTHLEALHEAGVRLFTDDGDSVEDDGLTLALMGRLAKLDGAIFAQHAEDPTLTSDGHMHDGAIARELGIAGMPAFAEESVVARDLDVVRRTGCRYHCQHVSTSGTIELIRKAKAEGLPVTAEVTPHHLTFDEEDVRGANPDFKMYPPLRAREDRVALISALLDGTIDVVATDHAPHSPQEKQSDFNAAPRGVIGLETAAAASWAVMKDPMILFDRLSTSPARIAGLEAHGHRLAIGRAANIVVFDPSERWIVTEFQSKSRNSPFIGLELHGKPIATIHEGEVVYEMESQPA